MASSQDVDLQSEELPSISESGTAFHTIDETFIADLSGYYLTMANKWESIAKLLGSDYTSSLKAEEATTQKLHVVIQKWLIDSHGPRSQHEPWKKLREVLNSVHLLELAKTIEKDLPLGLPQSTKEVIEGDARYLRHNSESSSRPGSASSQQSPHRTNSSNYLSRSPRKFTAPQTPPDQWFNQQTNYRFAIMVANDNELHATMHFLGGPRERWSKVTEDVVSYTYKSDEKLKNKIDVGDRFTHYVPIRVGKMPGVVVKCAVIGSFRPSGSHRTTLQLIKDASDGSWDLELIFIVGCCGAHEKTEKKEEEQLDSKKIKPNIVSTPAVPNDKPNEIVPLGTVLVADHIFQYAMGKLNDDGPEWMPTIMSGAPVNLYAVQYGDGRDISRIVKKVEPASFLSSDFVVKSKKTADTLADLHMNKKYVGFEMEGSGALTATIDAEIFVPDFKMPKVVLVKGVSDKAGEDKHKPCAIQFFPEKPIPNVNEDSRQQMCTISSLTLVLRYIIQFKAKSWCTRK